MTEAAVVILNYNGSDYLKKFLPGVIRYSEGCEIWVADNASTDNSIEMISGNFPEVKILPFEKNYGFCGGYNRALQHIKTKYCILLNSDIEVTSNWTKPLITMLRSGDQVAAAQPKILSFHNPEYFEYAGAAGGMIDRYGYPFCRGRLFETLEKDEEQYDNEATIFWASGACMAIKRQYFLDAGGFDDYFFAHMEEIDLCWRLNNKGLKICYVPDSTIYHVGGGTLPKDNPRKTYLNFRNSLLVLLKNLPASQLPGKLFIRMVLDFPAAIFLIVKGKIMPAFMVLKAHFVFYTVIFRYIKKRNSKTMPPQGMPGFYNKSIVMKYFFTGVRKTTDL